VTDLCPLLVCGVTGVQVMGSFCHFPFPKSYPFCFHYKFCLLQSESFVQPPKWPDSHLPDGLISRVSLSSRTMSFLSTTLFRSRPHLIGACLKFSLPKAAISSGFYIQYRFAPQISQLLGSPFAAMLNFGAVLRNRLAYVQSSLLTWLSSLQPSRRRFIPQGNSLQRQGLTGRFLYSDQKRVSAMVICTFNLLPQKICNARGE